MKFYYPLTIEFHGTTYERKEIEECPLIVVHNATDFQLTITFLLKLLPVCKRKLFV